MRDACSPSDGGPGFGQRRSAPVVSVIISTYNSLDLLRVALDHLAAQTMQAERIEVLVVDDGSTDATWNYLEERATGWPQLRIFSQPNSGTASVGRNRALRVATGQYVFFHDADDYLGDDALRRLVDVAETQDSDVVIGRVRRVGRKTSHQPSSRTALNADLVADNVWGSLGPHKLIRRSLVQQLGLEFCEDMVQGEDQVFIASCLFAARKVSRVGDYDYYHRHTSPAGTNLSSQPQSLHNKLLTATRMAALIAANTEPGRRRDAMFARVLLHTLGPALNRPFREATGPERAAFLSAMKAEVLPYLSPAHLNAGAQRVRLRLAVARDGNVSDILELNRRLSSKREYTMSNGMLLCDLGSRLNSLLPALVRAHTDVPPLDPRLRRVDVGIDSVELVIAGGTAFDAPWDSLRLVARQRSTAVVAEVLPLPHPGPELRFLLCAADLRRARQRAIARGSQAVEPAPGSVAQWDLELEGRLAGVAVATAPLIWSAGDGSGSTAPDAARGKITGVPTERLTVCRSGRDDVWLREIGRMREQTGLGVTLTALRRRTSLGFRTLRHRFP